MKKLLCALSILTLLPLNSLAATYNDVTYQTGIAGMPPPSAGSLTPLSDTLQFQDAQGQRMQIHYDDIRGIRCRTEATTTTTRHRGLALAGPNPVLLAGSAAATLFMNKRKHKDVSIGSATCNIDVENPQTGVIGPIVFTIAAGDQMEPFIKDLQDQIHFYQSNEYANRITQPVQRDVSYPTQIQY